MESNRLMVNGSLFVFILIQLNKRIHIKMQEDPEIFEPTTTQQRQRLFDQYSKEKFPDEKQSLCRYYLRGLCVFPKNICKYSHGVDDLLFNPYNNQPIVWQYKRTDYNQNKLIPKQCRYINLYEFQKDKLYSQEQLNTDKKARAEVRDQLVRQECEKFMELLTKLYPGEDFVDKFVEREFTRAGFNKPTMNINFKKICEYLCSSSESKYMVGKLVGGKQGLIDKLGNQQIDSEYTKIVAKKLVVLENMKITEQEIKRIMFQENPNVRLPPLNLHLKALKMGFMDYLKNLIAKSQELQTIVATNKLQFQSQPTSAQLVAWSIQYLSTQRLVLVDKFTADLIAKFKVTNNNTIAPVKPQLANKGFRFYYLPMMSFIYNSNSPNPLKHQPCPCNFKQRPDLTCLVIEPPSKPLEEVEVIDSDESFDRCCWEFLSSKVLSVDIEGKLRKGGFVQIIQFNNGKNVFLFDFYAITQVAFNFELFERVKLIIREKMLDPSVLKIFHDSRHDCLSLHQIINTCTLNVFDTSGVQVFKNQSEVYDKSPIITPAILNGISNVRTPGLNEVLKKYEAPHGINESKDEFHKLMSMSNKFGGIFHERPLHPEYKKYCVKDVLDLIYVFEVMSKSVPEEIYQYIGDRYVQNAYEATL